MENTAFQLATRNRELAASMRDHLHDLRTKRYMWAKDPAHPHLALITSAIDLYEHMAKELDAAFARL